MQITAYIAPFLLLPAAFRWVGGAFTTFTGALSDRSKGFFDKQRKFRAEKTKETKENKRTGNRFAGGNDDNWRGKMNDRKQRRAHFRQAAGESLLHPSTYKGNMRSLINSATNVDAADELLKSDVGRSVSGDDTKTGAAFDLNGSTDPKKVKEALLRRGRQMEDVMEPVMEEVEEKAKDTRTGALLPQNADGSWVMTKALRPKMEGVTESVEEQITDAAGNVTGTRVVLKPVLDTTTNEQLMKPVMQQKMVEVTDEHGNKSMQVERRETGNVFKDANGNINELGLANATSEVIRWNKAGGTKVAKVAAFKAMVSAGTAFNDDDPKMAEAIDDIAGDDLSLRGRLVADARSRAMQAGRIDQGGGGFGDTMGAVNKYATARRNGGKIKDENGNDVVYTAQDATNDIADSAARSQGPAQLLYGKPASTEAIAEAFSRRLSKALNKVGTASTETERHAALNEVSSTVAAIQGLHDAQGGSAMNNSSKVANIMGREFNLADLHPEARKLLTRTMAPTAVMTTDDTGKQVPERDMDGRVKMKMDFTYADTKPTITLKEAATNMASADSVFNENIRQWGDASRFGAERAASAGAEAAGVKTPGAPGA